MALSRHSSRSLFSDEFVLDLAKRYRIDEQQAPELKRALHRWATIYQDHRAEADNRPRPRYMKTELRRLLRSIDDLRSALEHLHPKTEDRFWLPEKWIDPPRGSTEAVTTSPFGHTIFQVPTGPNERLQFWITKARHFESLTILRRYCERAIAALPKDVGGQVRNEALRIWAVNIINYWETALGRNFTIKCYKGIPITKGAAFCVDAFKPIDPSVPVAKLVTAMRHATKTRPKRRLQEPTPAKG